MKVICVGGKIKPLKDIHLMLPHKTIAVFTYLEIFMIARGNSSTVKLVQHCNVVTEFKQVENKASNHVFGK